MIYPITNINEQTADPRYVDLQLEMCLASTWEATDGHYIQYHATEPRYRRIRHIRATIRFPSGQRLKLDPDFCRREYSRSSDHRWNLLVFERYTTGSKEDYNMLGFGIEMDQRWAAADFQQAGGGMATFFDDVDPYFEGERNGSFVRKQWGAANPESSYEGSIESFSIFELLKMAYLADVFNPVDGQFVP